MSESIFDSLAWLQYQRLWIIDHVVPTFRYSYFDILNKIVWNWRRYFMTRDVIDSVARLIFLVCVVFRPHILYQFLVQTKGCIQSYTRQKTTFQLIDATSSKIVGKFWRFNLRIFWYGEHISIFWWWENVVHPVS